jgi:iron complex transport system ATP-binding protein
MNDPGTWLVETRGLTLRAGGRTLLRGLDWRVRPGERWCVMGRNAVGKSTLLRALAGVDAGTRADPHADGSVLWLGRAQRDWDAVDAATVRALMPQHPSDCFPLSVSRLLELSIAVPGRRDPADVLAALDALALASRNVMQLSGGERQRVALAQCAVQGAPLMLMDEPVAFQDPAHQLQVARWLTGLRGVAIVASAHDVNWIARTATHVLAMTGEGAWRLGAVAEMLTPSLLAQTYGCGWRSIDGVWVAG